MKREIKEFLQEKDPILRDYIEDIFLEDLEQQEDIYFSLIKSITFQQLSGKVADIIFKRFLSLFDNKYPKPQTLLEIEHKELRNIGLSNNKARYIKNVAQFHIEYGIKYDILCEMSDEEIIKYLCQIKGVGKWTVEMILIFSLLRENIMPSSDLAISTKIKKIYGLKTEKRELIKEVEEVAQMWVPFRSYAVRAIWNLIDN